MKQSNRQGKDRFSEFMAGRGFYIALFLCIVAIGISGYFLIRTNYEPTPAEEPAVVAGPAEIILPDEPVIEPGEPVVPAAPIAEKNTEPEKPVEEPPERAEPAAALVWPVPGGVIHGYSVDLPVFSVTLGDWRTHSGIDIAAEIGDIVKAAGAGKVSTVYEDDLMGTTVVITHTDGLCSVYSNLADVPAVKEGDMVNAGDTIGMVGATAIAEISQSPHLHFEMLRDGLSVSPEEYLPAR